MNIAIVDDQLNDLRNAKNFLQGYLQQNFSEIAPQVKIFSFINAAKFINDFKSGDFDLLILDIFMKPFNGIQVAEFVREKDRDISIIFLTNSEDYILDGYKVFAIGYFLKPLKENVEQFSKTFYYIFPKLLESRKKLCVNVKGNDMLVPYKNIRYIDIDDNHHTCIHLRDKNFSVTTTYEECLNELKNDPRFVECYHRVILNMDFIKIMNEDNFILEDNTPIPISKRKSKAAKLKYMSHLIKISSAGTW